MCGHCHGSPALNLLERISKKSLRPNSALGAHITPSKYGSITPGDIRVRLDFEPISVFKIGSIAAV